MKETWVFFSSFFRAELLLRLLFPPRDKNNQRNTKPGEGGLNGGKVQKLPSAVRVWPRGLGGGRSRPAGPRVFIHVPSEPPHRFREGDDDFKHLTSCLSDSVARLPEVVVVWGRGGGCT